MLPLFPLQTRSAQSTWRSTSVRCGCCCGRAGRTTARPGRRPCGRCWRLGTGTVSRRPGARAASDVEEKGRGIKGGKSFGQAFGVLKILPEIRKRNPVKASWPGGQTSVVRAASGCGRYVRAALYRSRVSLS